MLPTIVATLVFELAKVTGIAESPPVASKSKGASPKILFGSELKLITWAAFVTTKV